MIVADPGHRYILRTLDGEVSWSGTELRFVKRQGPGYPGNVGHYEGTTTQEVLRALIDRGQYVNAQIPCGETEAAIACFREALYLLELRAARRHGRVLDLATLEGIEHLPVCAKCGHIGCDGGCHV